MQRTAPFCTLVSAVALAVALGGCGTTRIITNDGNARIYVDGAYVGTGTAEMRRRGIPSSATVQVKTPDGRSADKRVKREFTVTTFVVGLVTYGVGMLTVWEYPEAVYVALEEPERPSSWESADEMWMTPLPGWTPPPRPPAQPAPEEPAQPAPDAPSPWDQPPQ